MRWRSTSASVARLAAPARSAAGPRRRSAAAAANASQHALVLGEQRRAAADQPQVAARSARRSAAAPRSPGGAQPACSTSIHSPLRAVARLQRDRLHAERLARPLEDAVQRLLARRGRRRRAPTASRPPRCARSAARARRARELDRAADDRRDGDEDDERDRLVGVGDVERVNRLDEEVVDQQRRGDRRAERDDDAADERDRPRPRAGRAAPGPRARASLECRRAAASAAAAPTPRATSARELAAPARAGTRGARAVGAGSSSRSLAADVGRPAPMLIGSTVLRLRRRAPTARS